MDHQEEYYKEARRELESQRQARATQAQATTNAELAKYGPIVILIMIAVLAIYVLLLAVMSPGVLLAYITYRITGNNLSPIPMWLIAILTSASIAYYIFLKYKDKKKIRK